jgi:predicted  nucleic acid-binding Zn-ribbon protein
MKKTILLLTAVALVTAAVGCKKSGTDDNSMNGDTNPPTVSENAATMATNAWQKTKEGTTNAWAEIKESLSSTADYGYDKKQEFLTAATNDLAVLDQRIQDLSDRAANAGDSVKADAQSKLQDLRAKRAALDQKMDDVRNSTETNWTDVKTAFRTSYDDVKSSVKTTWQWLKDKMSQ